MKSSKLNPKIGDILLRRNDFALAMPDWYPVRVGYVTECQGETWVTYDRLDVKETGKCAVERTCSSFVHGKRVVRRVIFLKRPTKEWAREYAEYAIEKISAASLVVAAAQIVGEAAKR